MRILILIIILHIELTALCQHRQRLCFSDQERFNLRGKIKSYTHIDYQPIFEQDSLKDLRIDDFILLPNNYKLEFDKNGYRQKKIEFSYMQEKDSLVDKGLWIYKYDKHNRILQETYCPDKFSMDTIKWFYTYPNDSTTLIHQYGTTYAFTNQFYKYLQEGWNEDFWQSNADSSYVTRKRFVYDMHNRMIRTEEYGNQNYIQYIRAYTYPDSLTRNPNIKVRINTKYNTPAIITTYEYDKFGNEIKASIIGKYARANNTKYKYDKNRNWIERSVYLSNGRIKISKRKFEYWE